MPRIRIRLTLFALLTMIFALVPGIASATTMSATIDFEGLSEGAIVTILSSGSGISGDPIGGSVGVSAVGGSNKAMIFDSNCSSAGCSGQDPDLAGSTGKVLIVSEDGDTTDPDDNHDGGTLSFALPGTFTVVSLQVTDYGDRSVATGSVSVGGSLIALPTGGANGLQQTVIVGLTGNSIIITTNDSFSVDNIELEWETPDSPGTGTVGYWKNHPDAWPVDEITIGGVLYTKAEAIAAMQTPGRGDKTYNMFAQLVAAKLNVAIGNDDSCISSDITAANAWMTANPLDSNVRARSDEWRDPGSGLHGNLDDYNNGRLCAPHRD